MTINDAVVAALPIMRAQAESLMVDTCTIDRLTGGSHWDEDLQKTVPTWGVVHVGVSCHFDTDPTAARQIMTDEVTSPRSPSLRLPHSVLGIEPDDRVTITAVGPASDPEHMGAVVWVTSAESHTHPVERVLSCRWIK